ncbi:methyltransferase domain-containing protein [Duganella sp. FT94W]|uniref:Methyltransferase domain-containing protein n=1 Tax=Duganella lactea TaxID=2692173 RepID=A0ABW9V5I6_9BURK|nr:methyltransferase domain-containing protein [Duganella lactea]MYM34956.1 methyltransferase domain-containing protein [Duganella lactea]
MTNALTQHIERLTRATRMLAIIGASLKFARAGNPDSAIGAEINQGLRLILGDEPGDVFDTADIDALITQIDMAFAESGELWRHPDRTAGWQVEDEQLLQAMGRASRNAFDRILVLAQARPSLSRALRERFLDVGTGVAGIALRAAETCPELRIDAIDIWEPALRLAEANIAASPHADRIQLHRQDVAALRPDPRYTLVWLPTMFLRRDLLLWALPRIAAASAPGGWLIAAMYTQPEDPFMAVMSSLRTLRSGGEVTSPAELEEMLRAQGYVDIERDVAPVATFVLARRPSA